MKEILDLIERKKQAYAELPLFAFMQDTQIHPRQRLSFAPCMAHFIMSFSDLNKYVFRNQNSINPVQELVNKHTYEDDHHYPWFLTDLNKLGFNSSERFVDTLRFLWSENTKITRQLSYQLAAYTLHTNPIYKVVVIEAIEATGNVLFSLTAKVAEELESIHHEQYQYFGQFHLNLETGHIVGLTDSKNFLKEIMLTEEQSQIAADLVEKVFDIFTQWADELLTYATTEKSAEIFAE